MPMMGAMADQVDEGEIVKVEAMIRSMTPDERTGPHTIDRSRTSRIARGSGRKPKEVSDLVKRFDQMRTLMSQLGSGKGGGLLSKVPGMGRLAGAGGMDPAALLGDPSGGGSNRLKSRDSDARKKNKRKQARKSRRKGRRK